MPATEAIAVTLTDSTDAHFAWMLGEGPPPDHRLHLPVGGLGTAEMLKMLRNHAAKLRALRCGGNWLMTAGTDVVGLCSYKDVPDKDGVAEIGYGVAASHRGRGYATQAIAAILNDAMLDSLVRCVTAGTAHDNIASHRALIRNGFVAGERYFDAKWGDSMRWRRDLGKGLRL